MRTLDTPIVSLLSRRTQEIPLADLPNLPLESKALIEHARVNVIRTREVCYPLCFESPIGSILKGLQTSVLTYSPKMPSTLMVQLKNYATELFDAEAGVYIKHAGSDFELRIWLSSLALRIEAEVTKETEVRSRSHDYHCTLTERISAIREGLQRIDHWCEVAKNDYEATLTRGYAALARSQAARTESALAIQAPGSTPVSEPKTEIIVLPNPWAVWETNRNLPDTTATLRLYNACKTFREKTDSHILNNKELWRTVEKTLTPGQKMSHGEPDPEAMLSAFCKHCTWFLSEVSETFIDHISRRGLSGKIGIEAFKNYAQGFTAQAFENNWKWGLDHLRLKPHDEFYRSLATEVTEGKVQQLTLLWSEGSGPSSELTTAHRPTNISDQLDEACLKADISHEEQADRIGISRTTYFEVKAGRGGRKARRKVSIYITSIASETSSTKPD